MRASRTSRRWACISAATRRAPTSAARPAASISPASCIPRAAGSNSPGSSAARWKQDGVQLIDRLFVTGLMRGGSDRITGAVGINSRTGEFNVIKARDHHRRHQRHHLPLGLRARHHRHRHLAGLSRRRGLAQRRVLLRPPRHAEVLFRGHHLRDPGGRALGQRQGRGVHGQLRARLGRSGRRSPHRQGHGDGEPQRQHAALSRHVADSRAHAGRVHPEQGAMDGLFLPQARRRGQDRHVRHDAVLRAQPDDQDGHPHRLGLPLRRAGAVSAGLAQAGCANHFAGFHIGLCVGNGWIAGKSAIEDLDRLPTPSLDAAEVRALHAETKRRGALRPRPNPTASCATCRR